MKKCYRQIVTPLYIATCMLCLANPVKAIQSKDLNPTEQTTADKKVISGTVIDKSQTPLIGVTITQKGTNNGTITDADGRYELKLTEGTPTPVLTFSYIGYKTIELNARQVPEKLVMEEDAITVDELVVVGYAVQKKKDLTGSTSSLKADETRMAVTTSLDQMMQGNLSGVNITNASGMPGGAVRVSVRGVGSINGSNEPLFVIDGVPVSNTDNSGLNGRYGGSVQNPLSMINPSDIESIDVLKDAAATAIYGSRATNGVVMVTTKRGKKGQRTTVNLNASYGIQSLPKTIEMSDSELYLTVRNEAVNNYNTQNNLQPGDNLYKAAEVNPRPGEPDVDWIDLITHDQAAVQNYEVSVSSGNEKTRFFSSVGYFDQEGIILTNRFRRYSLRTNIDHDISRYFQTGTSISLSKTINNRVPNDNVGNGIFTRSIEQRPFDVPFKEDASYMIGGVDVPRHNGIQVLNEQESKNEWYRVLANAYLSIKPFEGLEYKLSLSGDVRYSNDYLKLTKNHPYGSPKGEISDYRSLSQNYLLDNTLTYTKSIHNLNLTALGGYSMQEMSDNSSSIVGKDFPSPNFDYINAAGYIKSASTTGGSNRLISTFFRLNLSYLDRYLFTFSMRADGSSKFADGNKWGTFPSASGAWRISSEPFYPKNAILSDLKLRVSWGMTGNQEGIGNYDSRSLASGGQNYNGSDGIAITTLANPDLRWEKSDQTNVGVDLGFLNGKITAGIDFFIKNTNDLLYNRPLHTTTGFSSITQNIGSMRNTGIEFSLESHNIRQDNFSWDTQFNISSIKNELTSLIDEKPIPVGNHVLQVGEAIGTFYMYQMEGIYQKDSEVPEPLYKKGVRAGDIKYTDVNNDGDLSPEDKVIVGKPLPDFYGGLTNRFTFKNFDLTIFNTFSVGNDVYSSGMSGIDAVGHYNYGIRKEVALNRWQGEGTSNSIPRAMISTHNTQASTYLLHDGSYFKFKDVTLGYTLPVYLTQKWGISNLRIYASAQNLWTISSYPGYDPEVSYSVSDSKTMGEDAMTVPQLRTFVFGLNVTF